MKLRSIRLCNHKRFVDHEINFYDDLTKQIRSRTVIVGKNGSGKTTILEVIYAVLELLHQGSPDLAFTEVPLVAPHASELCFEFDLNGVKKPLMIKTGSVRDKNLPDIFMGVSVSDTLSGPPLRKEFDLHSETAHQVLRDISSATAGIDENPTIGNVMYFPTDRVTHFDVRGDLTNERPRYLWTYRYDRGNRGWNGSLESYLCWLYFRDLKLKEKDAHHPSQFEEFRHLVNLFLEGKWIEEVNLNYRVVIADDQGKKYGLEALSSGEKQIVMLIGEIYRHIVKGSLLLIDEPELHLHPVWQRVFVEVLTRLCKKYDAQMILTTQSPRIAESVLSREVVSLDNLLEESNG